MYHDFFIGIDPGNKISGMTVLDNGHIVAALNLEHHNLYSKVTEFILYGAKIAIEDIRPYSLRLTPQIIDTCKFIGELVYRLRNEANASVELISRWEVKKWVFDTFPHIVTPLIERKIEKKGQVVASTGKFRTPTAVYVDDKIIMEAMKFHYKIPKPPAGSGYKYGLKEHSWQALALALLHHSSSH